MTWSCEAIVFDLDGTLIDSAADLQAAVNEVLAAQGWDKVSTTQVAGFIGHGLGHLLRCCVQAVGAQPDEQHYQRLLTQVQASYNSLCLVNTKAYAGTEQMLEKLQKLGYKLAVCTNKPEAISHKILTGLGLAEYIDILVGGDTLEVKKPDPAVLQYVLDKLGVDKSQAIYVGDSITDIKLAAALDIPAFILPGGYPQGATESAMDAQDKAWTPIGQLSDLLGMLHTKLPATSTELQALLFDVDGTLADSEEMHRQAFNQSFATHELDWHWDRDLYRDLLAITGGQSRIQHYQQNYPVTRHLSRDEIVAVHEHKNHNYGELVRSRQLKLRPGILRTIESCRQQGVKMAIVTTSSRVNVETLLESSLGQESLDWFDVIVCGEDVRHKKPKPDAYLLALNSLELAPENCLAIEDSANGYKAAAGARVKSVITLNDYTAKDNFGDADCIVSDLGDAEHKPLVIVDNNQVFAELPSEFVTLDDLRNCLKHG